ncbi:MAG TPA: hypothetical protein VKU87_01925 [Thermomicrobiaceae bacterium]|nr:hypothetical protein [Thermomicrobiaceae bacterium]
MEQSTKSPVAIPDHPAAMRSRALLRLDGLVVLAAGVALLAEASPLARSLGLGSRWPLVAVGAACLPYGGWLSWAAGREPRAALHRLTGTIAAANLVWVIASLGLFVVFATDPTMTGRWLVVAQAGAVSLFAASEAWQYHRSTNDVMQSPVQPGTG